MKKIFVAAALGAALFSGAALADTMGNSFGNTLTTTGADGVTVRWLFNPDQTYTMLLPDGTSVAGSWARLEDNLCVTPASGGEAQCAPILDGKAVGDTWTVETGTGPVTVAIVAGRP